ncbi:MAG: efflux system, outer rane lipoprotein NodT family [Polaromonas sp.]|nr:efflux system, outer rane lipoprotein NodT family [Polaromonas sp.]
MLQRRPDVAAAQHAVAAANAQIGVARAAFYPSITLGTSLGLESRTLASLLSGPSLLWSLGTSLAQPLFDGSRSRARFAGAQAAHEVATAAYRRTVLQALQEVEDGLSSLDALGRAARSAQAATGSADKALTIAQARYTGGLATYLDVVSAQQNLLNSQRQAAQISGQRLATTAYLVKTLGGGWNDADAATHAAPKPPG